MRVNVLAASLYVCACCSLGWAGLNDGLVAFYPFNGNAEDLSGHGRHGTVVGATPTADEAGLANGAFAFDGVDDYIDLGPTWPDMERMSVVMRLFIPARDRMACIFVDTQDLSLKMDESDRIKLVAKKNGAGLVHGFILYESLESQQPFSITGRWIHLAWVMTEDHSTIYVDGIARRRYYESGSNVGAHDIWVGATYSWPSPQARECWEGKISSLMIYDRALADTEIEMLFQLSDTQFSNGGSDTGSEETCLYVDDDAWSDPGPYDAFVSDPQENGATDHPFDSIQEAIDLANDGDTIVVREGVYYESIDFLGKSIHVTGFDPNTEAQRNRPCPMIDADYQDTVVTFAAGEDSNARLSGFTLTRGFGRYAGGILCVGSHPRISNCLIVGNRAESLLGGGAVYCSDSNAVFDACTMSGNYGGPAGGGFFSKSSQNTITNSILWGNLPAEIAFPMFGEPSLPPMFTYSDLALEAYGVGNLNVDPLFVCPGYWAEVANPAVPADAANADTIWIDGDYRLREGSACADAGDPNAVVDADQLDLDGHPRLANGRLDMGPCEASYTQLTFTALYNDTFIPLTPDTTAADPETTFIGTATIQLDAFFKLKLLGQAFPASDAGGHWSVSLSPDIIGPGMNIDVEVTVRGTDVDISKLPATVSEMVLAEVEVAGIPTP